MNNNQHVLAYEPLDVPQVKAVARTAGRATKQGTWIQTASRHAATMPNPAQEATGNELNHHIRN